jgi:carbamoyltransferase
MALAALGQPRYSFDRIHLDDDGFHVEWPATMPKSDDASHYGNLFMDAFYGWQADMARQVGGKWRPRKTLREGDLRPQADDAFPTAYLDLAASVQRTLESVYTHLVKICTANDDYQALCVSGGTALNCTMNGKVATSGMIPEIFVQPASSDAGTALGAALELAHHLGVRADYTMRDAYLGPSFENHEVEEVLRATGTAYKVCEDPASRAAELIASGHVVGWFQGRVEFGPRALGARSILAHPGKDGMKDHLNGDVKHRARFRPFAISALAEHASNLVAYESPSPFMLLGLPVRQGARDSIAEATHVDGTTRPQTVDADVAPGYWHLVDDFYSRTGIPAVLNTSFNDESEPIVCTPHDALRTFASTPLDDLIMENYWVSKAY